MAVEESHQRGCAKAEQAELAVAVAGGREVGGAADFAGAFPKLVARESSDSAAARDD